MNVHRTPRERDRKAEKRSEKPQVGDPSNVEEVDDHDVAEHLGFDLDDQEDSAQLGDVDDLADLVDVVEDVVAENERLRERVEDLEETVEDQQETIQDLAARTNEVAGETRETREIAQSAVATAHQVEAEVEEELSDDTEGPEVNRQLPGDVEPSSSPLDFFANCRAESVREMFVVESNRTNSFRAVQVAKRWDEFGIVDDGDVVWKRSNVEEALTAEMGERPHPETVRRVWNKLSELGSSDVEETERQVGRSQDKYDVLRMDVATAKRLQEGRYLHLDLLDGAGPTAGGITPVVTGGEGAEV